MKLIDHDFQCPWVGTYLEPAIFTDDELGEENRRQMARVEDLKAPEAVVAEGELNECEWALTSEGLLGVRIIEGNPNHEEATQAVFDVMTTIVTALFVEGIIVTGFYPRRLSSLFRGLNDKMGISSASFDASKISTDVLRMNSSASNKYVRAAEVCTRAEVQAKISSGLKIVLSVDKGYLPLCQDS